MENKKRLSILKKPQFFEDSPTPTVTKSNRRISFSGTKSVKEFMAGEDKATIWGTSYEEAADCVHPNVKKSQVIISNDSMTTSNFSSGNRMMLRNRKCISINTQKFETECNKENIVMIPENIGDTTELTQSIQSVAYGIDNRTFDGTVDITLNSFELQHCKFSKASRTRSQKGHLDSFSLQPIENENSPTHCSFDINDKEREHLLRNALRSRKSRSPISDMEAPANSHMDEKSNVGSLLEAGTINIAEDIEKARESLEEAHLTREYHSNKDSEPGKRQTLILNQEIEIDTDTTNQTKPTKIINDNRKTLVFNNGEKMEEVEESSKRQKTVVCHLPVRNKTTITFESGEDLGNSSVVVPKPCGKNRQTLVFYNGDDLIEVLEKSTQTQIKPIWEAKSTQTPTRKTKQAQLFGYRSSLDEFLELERCEELRNDKSEIALQDIGMDISLCDQPPEKNHAILRETKNPENSTVIEREHKEDEQRNRQTIFCVNPSDKELTSKTCQKEPFKLKTSRRTAILNDPIDLEMTEMFVKAEMERPRGRQTALFNEMIAVDETESKATSTSKTDRQTVIGNSSVALDESARNQNENTSNKQQGSKQLIIFDRENAMEGSCQPQFTDEQLILSQKKQRKVRHTLLLNEPLEIEAEEPKELESSRSAIVFGRENVLNATWQPQYVVKEFTNSEKRLGKGRPTLLLNAPLEMGVVERKEPQLSRRTVVFDHGNAMDETCQPECMADQFPIFGKRKENLRSTLLLNEPFEIEAVEAIELQPNRRTVVFGQENIDDTCQPLSIVDNFNSSEKGLVKSRPTLNKLLEAVVSHDDAMDESCLPLSIVNEFAISENRVVKARSPLELEEIEREKTQSINRSIVFGQEHTLNGTSESENIIDQFSGIGRSAPTLLLNKPLQIDASEEKKQQLSRRTVVYGHEHALDEMMIETLEKPQLSKKSEPKVNRRTILLNESIEDVMSIGPNKLIENAMVETKTETFKLLEGPLKFKLKALDRKTIIFEKRNILDDNTSNQVNEACSVKNKDLTQNRIDQNVEGLLDHTSANIGIHNTAVNWNEGARTRRTVIFDNNTEILEETITKPSNTTQQKSLPNEKRRQTVLFGEDCDIDQTFKADCTMAPDHKTRDHSTYQSLQSRALSDELIAGRLSSTERSKQTILINNDIDLTMGNTSERVQRRASVFHTTLNPQMCETLQSETISEQQVKTDMIRSCIERSVIVNETPIKHSISYGNTPQIVRQKDSVDLDWEPSEIVCRDDANQRRTIFFDSIEKIVETTKSIRDMQHDYTEGGQQTVVFDKESDDLELTMKEIGTIPTTRRSTINHAQDRRTLYFNKAEILNETKIPETANASRMMKISSVAASNITSDENQLNQERSTKLRRDTIIFDQGNKINETIIDCSAYIAPQAMGNIPKIHEATAGFELDISGIENFNTTEHQAGINASKDNVQFENTLLVPRSQKQFEDNSWTTTGETKGIFRKLTQDSNYLTKTVHGSLHTTSGSSPFSLNTTEALCNIDPNKITGAGYKRSTAQNSDSDNTATNGFKQIRRDYGELTVDMTFNNSHDDIEKTQLSLVETISINTTLDTSEVCDASRMILNEAARNKDPTLKNITQSVALQQSLCKKCKNCRRSINMNDTTIDGFVLDKKTEKLELNFDCLKKLEGKPRCIDVLNEFKNRQITSSFNSAYEEDSIMFPVVPPIEVLLKNYAEGYLQKLEEKEKLNDQNEAFFPLIPSFEFLFKNRLESEECNWRFNDLRLPVGVLECRHKTIRSIRLIIRFMADDLFERNCSKLEFKEITLSECPIYKNLTPFDKVVQYQIFVRLPNDLTAFCKSSSQLYDFLDHIHSICDNSHELTKSLLKIAIIHRGWLRINESDNCIIEKTVRSTTATGLRATNTFRIRVGNIEKLSWHDIEMPPRCYFGDAINSLPIGLDFFKCFLSDPIKYLK